MLNFTVGPVQMQEEIREIGREEIPYFRTPEFSALMLENERMMLEFMNAPQGARAVFLTGSGTAAMEAAVMNLFDEGDKLLVINGGSFGHRFTEICDVHGIAYTEIVPEFGSSVTEEQLLPYEGQGYTGLLVNLHETSVGVLYDIRMIAEFCRKNRLRLVIDSISSFLADPFDMAELGADIVLTGSQKALAVPPGISILTVSPAAIQKMQSVKVKSLYFDLKDYLKNGERGQTPFTPAVSVLIQIHKRLSLIARDGIAAENARIAALAQDFRAKISALPFEITSSSLSNAVTPLTSKNGVSAYRIFEILKDEYGIFVCPNGGELRDKIFRVGHIGNLTVKDNDTLIAALCDLQKRGLI